jgi:hypothetical protein
VFGLSLQAISAERARVRLGWKAFLDGGVDSDVFITGTLTGPDVPYKNNSVAVSCLRERRECITYKIVESEPNQIDRLDPPDIYPVIKWTPTEIVASDTLYYPGCIKVTITLQRQVKAALWVREPVNQANYGCKDADPHLHKWTIEDAPGWTAK